MNFIIKQQHYKYFVISTACITILAALITFLLWRGKAINEFNTLEHLQQYAARQPEDPPTLDKNWLDPDYSDFHRQQQHNFIFRILHHLGLEVPHDWSTEVFQELLSKITKQRLKNKLRGKKIARLVLQEPSNFYIWGDVHGAYHSLVRGLTELYDQKIIDNNLKIIAPNTYFIFNGDFINRSAYTLETLTIALLLLEKNPENVFYIRGKHENNNHWKNYALKA